ncbi:hypothetical protein [Longitalea arenae]|uniref:hypothetical protein n=1 Tax=Longitalea arenae TaxID=2812558 RepID=UPI001966D99D|nr:hypothetical protein [Longitalea arenae]
MDMIKLNYKIMKEYKEYLKDVNTLLIEFLRAAAEDPRIGPVHISLYVAILHQYKLQEYKLPISVYSRDLMRLAKISASNTYHKYIQELHRYGFIQYLPSYNPVSGSSVYPIKIN